MYPSLCTPVQRDPLSKRSSRSPQVCKITRSWQKASHTHGTTATCAQQSQLRFTPAAWSLCRRWRSQRCRGGQATTGAVCQWSCGGQVVAKNPSCGPALLDTGWHRADEPHGEVSHQRGYDQAHAPCFEDGTFWTRLCCLRRNYFYVFSRLCVLLERRTETL